MNNLDSQNKKIRLNLRFFVYAAFALVVLKVSGFLDWSWGWVLAPLYLLMAPFGIVLALVSLAVLAIGLILAVSFVADAFGEGR